MRGLGQGILFGFFLHVALPHTVLLWTSDIGSGIRGQNHSV